MRIYVASSWRNTKQPEIVMALRQDGHQVYDFRNPAPGDHGFHWSEIDPSWQWWTPTEYRAVLRDHPLAVRGFQTDMAALASADAVVLILPCGRSAHLEFGWACGAGKISAILLDESEPELMNSMADALCVNLDELRAVLEGEASRLTAASASSEREDE